MKKLHFIIIAMVASLLLIGGQTYGQARKSTAMVAERKGAVKGDIIKPVEAKDAAKMADKLTSEGWKTDKYTIKEQLISTWTLMSEFNEKTSTSKYAFAHTVNTLENLRDAKEKNYMDAMDRLGQQLMAPIALHCKAVMIQKNLKPEQEKEMLQILMNIPNATIQRMSKKSMEIYVEKDNSYTVETYFFVDKDETLEAIQTDCINYCKGKSMDKTYISILEVAFKNLKTKKF